MKQVYIIVLNTCHGQADFYNHQHDCFYPNRKDAKEYLFLENAQEALAKLRNEEVFENDYITIRMEYV